MDRLSQLQKTLAQAFKNHSNSENTQRLNHLEKIDRRLYGMFLIETFHYTRHNARNQARVATRDELLDINYMKFCLKHAMEEAGHEYMAFADLNSMGVEFLQSELPPPLPETETLIAYLYRVSDTGNPMARLGYSYWAESCYGYTDGTKTVFKELLDLKTHQMTFLEAHAAIDVAHFEEVKFAINRFVKTEADWKALEEVMLHSLKLTATMMDRVIGQYLLHLEGQPTRYGILDRLLKKPA
ncbi:MAG: iron-containing redox enzyme family protein [Methylotenera sp.]|nr:iron-containing redox enzyme family protein [Oligoflexia bacterium]